jgi:TRAP-type C4-dicarboxylate transport system substrate-binding protein
LWARSPSGVRATTSVKVPPRSIQKSHVDKATNGSLKIQVHPAGSLVKHPEIKRAVRQGTAPIGEILASLAANEAPVYGFDSLPFLATGYAIAKKLYAAQKPYLQKQLESKA